MVIFANVFFSQPFKFITISTKGQLPGCTCGQPKYLNCLILFLILKIKQKSMENISFQTNH